MEITYDPAKDAANIAKHSVSLAEASRLDWGTALVHFVDFVDRADGRRVISLRKANQREFDRYVAYIDSSDRSKKMRPSRRQPCPIRMQYR